MPACPVASEWDRHAGAYIYGYDSAGNPTLTNAGCAPEFEFPG